MSNEKTFNKVVVGPYYAICVAPGCGILLEIPVQAYQKGARRAADSKIITEADISGAEEHFRTVHPELTDPDDDTPFDGLPFKD